MGNAKLISSLLGDFMKGMHTDLHSWTTAWRSFFFLLGSLEHAGLNMCQLMHARDSQPIRVGVDHDDLLATPDQHSMLLGGAAQS